MYFLVKTKQKKNTIEIRTSGDSGCPASSDHRWVVILAHDAGGKEQISSLF